MPSLTLTNPDMILPYDGSERQSSTPSPPSQLVYLSNLNARYNSSEPHSASSSSASTGRAKKNFSRNWTHEDVTPNPRRLSDIGEELSPKRLGGFDEEEMSQDQGLGDAQRAASDAKDNAVWSSSNSTVSAGSARPREVTSPATVREASPVQMENAIGKPSNENEEVKKVLSPDSGAHISGSHISTAAATGKGPGEDFSSAILSSEAERILENAKKRLMLMEGNLNRARSTTRLTPSPSPSAPGNIQPLGGHKPAGGLYQSISRADRRGSTLRRQSLIASQDASTNRHSRVHSDTNFPSESSMSNDSKRPSRSVSAMGASTSSFHHDDRSFQYEPTRAYLTHRSSISSIKPPYSESPQSAESPQLIESPVPEESTSSGSPTGLGISADDDSNSSPGDFSPVYSSSGPPSRAQSQLQVRDLQYQMKGLHIKISSLKVRTQEDNMRRRSLQSLRTPSPLTQADAWYANALELREGQSSRESNGRRDVSSEYAREARSSNEQLNAVKRSERTEESPVDQNRASISQAPDTRPKPRTESYDGRQSVAESLYEDAEEDFEDGDIDREALDEILREPLDEDLQSLDEFPGVDTRPHEEREDAFDYEHFILHSALGNYSRQIRRPSQSSRVSVETTRPNRSVRHSRTNSAMSVSTVATFATAIEGDMPEEEDDLLYWDRKFNHELRHNHSQSRQANPIQTDRSVTPRGVRNGEDEDGSVTPVDQQLTPRRVDMTGRSSSATAGSATPTSLVSSLVSTVRAASSPHPGSVTPTSAGGINDDDTQILEQLFSSLGNVCMDLQAIMTSPDPDLKEARVLRRRLDAARRVLDGELDT
ncbi:hypothetical protein N7490_007396 [Penicillium lividum]|nr:hypothetical protein N7490_007396 [Penicillium lividum]